MDHFEAADRVQLAALRALSWTATVDPVQRVAALALGAARLGEMADRQARAAVEAGVSMGRVGKALGISRQAAWRRYSEAAREAA